MPENQNLPSPTSDIDSVEQPPETAPSELSEAERERLIAQMDAIIQQEKDIARQNDVDYHTARYHDAVETRSALEHGLHPDDIRIGFLRRKVATTVFELMPNTATE